MKTHTQQQQQNKKKMRETIKIWRDFGWHIINIIDELGKCERV